MSISCFLSILLGFAALCVNMVALDDWRKYLRAASYASHEKGSRSRARKASQRRAKVGLHVTWIWLLGFAAVSLATGFPNAANLWGDWAAGMFAPVAFGWLVLGYFQQGEELRIQASELNASVKQQSAISDAARKQTALMIAAQRPWVEISGKISALTFDQNGCLLDIELTLWNAGNSPAQQIIILGNSRLGGQGIEIDQAQLANQARQQVEAVKDTHLGFALFPEKRDVYSIKARISQVQLNRVLQDATDHQLLNIHLAVCLHYKFANGGEGWSEKLFTLWGWDFNNAIRGPLGHARPSIPIAEMRLDEQPTSRGLS